MSEIGTEVRTEVTDEDRHEQPVDVTDPDSPWHGIPAALLDGTYSHATDSAGGCG